VSHLVERPGRGRRDLLHVDERVGEPPAGVVLGEERPQVLVGHVGPLAENDTRERPLLPRLVVDGDDGRLRNPLVGHQRVLQFDAGDPLPAGTDDVLLPLDDLQRVPGVDQQHHVRRVVEDGFVGRTDGGGRAAGEEPRSDPVTGVSVAFG